MCKWQMKKLKMNQSIELSQIESGPPVQDDVGSSMQESEDDALSQNPELI